MTDPTLETLAALNDPSRWTIVKNVPVFKAHTRPATKDRPEIRVGVSDLNDIVKNCRAMEAAGVPVRVTLGHVRLEESEEAQPTVVGFARNARVGTFGPNNEPAVLLDFQILNEYAAEALRYPYRSVEYYPKKKEIRGVALLKRDPELDLGIVFYQHGHHFTAYERHPMEKTDMDETGEMNEMNKTAVESGDEETLSPEDERKAEAYMRYYMKKYSWLGKAKEQYSSDEAGNLNGGPAMPGPTNVGLPGMDSDDKPMKNSRTRDDLSVKYARLESEFARVTHTLHRRDCEQMVRDLQSEGYSLDFETEVRHLVPMTEPQRKARCDYIRRYYAVRPDAVGPIRLADTQADLQAQYSRTSPGGVSVAELDLAVAYMNDHPGCEWADALHAVRKRGKQ